MSSGYVGMGKVSSCQSGVLKQPEEGAAMVIDLLVPHRLRSSIVRWPATRAVHLGHSIGPQVSFVSFVKLGIFVGPFPRCRVILPVENHIHVTKEQSFIAKLASLHGRVKSDSADGHDCIPVDC